MTTTQRGLFVGSFTLVVIVSVALLYGLARVLPWYAWLVIAFNIIFMLLLTNILKIRAVEHERRLAVDDEAVEQGRYRPYDA